MQPSNNCALLPPCWVRRFPFFGGGFAPSYTPSPLFRGGCKGTFRAQHYSLYVFSSLFGKERKFHKTKYSLKFQTKHSTLVNPTTDVISLSTCWLKRWKRHPLLCTNCVIGSTWKNSTRMVCRETPMRLVYYVNTPIGLFGKAYRRIRVPKPSNCSDKT